MGPRIGASIARLMLMNISEYYDEIERLWPKAGQPPSGKVVDVCLRAVVEYPESSTLWYNLGIAMQRCTEDYGYTCRDYLRCFENAVKYDLSNAEAFEELGYVLDIYFDDYDKAEHAFQKAIEYGAGSDAYFGRARVLAEMGKTDDAVNSISENVCPFHDDPEIQKLRSEILDGSWCPPVSP